MLIKVIFPIKHIVTGFKSSQTNRSAEYIPSKCGNVADGQTGTLLDLCVVR